MTTGRSTLAATISRRPKAQPNNGMQRSADTKAVMFPQSGRAPADAGRWAASLFLNVKETQNEN
jgi:hypothetical protein